MKPEIVVIKFGGTSVGSLERIQLTAQRVAAIAAEHPHLVVVVSAMSGETDRLLKLGTSLNAAQDSEALREMDSLAATGEQVSAALLSLALQKLGCQARSFTAHQVNIATDGRFQRARIRSINSWPLLDSLERGYICVVTGFQGTDDSGNLVTLGRGGSDTSAVAIAIALNAALCEIYTDVDGVYTADPRLVPAARKIPEISYEEMLELASTGAKVLMIRSVELAMKKQLNLAVRTSFSDTPGTLIKTMNENLEEPIVTGLSHALQQAKVSLIGLPGSSDSLATALAPLARDDISVDFITQNIGTDGRMSLAFTIEEKLLDRAITSLRSHLPEAEFPHLRVDVDKNLAKVSAVGIGMRTHAGVAHRVFSTLTKAGIPIHMALSTEIRVSCLIATDDCQRALQVLHQEFFEGAVPVAPSAQPPVGTRKSQGLL
jgi:aspartate kinase